MPSIDLNRKCLRSPTFFKSKKYEKYLKLLSISSIIVTSLTFKPCSSKFLHFIKTWGLYNNISIRNLRENDIFHSNLVSSGLDKHIILLYSPYYKTVSQRKVTIGKSFLAHCVRYEICNFYSTGPCIHK